MDKNSFLDLWGLLLCSSNGCQALSLLFGSKMIIEQEDIFGDVRRNSFSVQTEVSACFALALSGENVV